jgi:hypothetical protein
LVSLQILISFQDGSKPRTLVLLVMRDSIEVMRNDIEMLRDGVGMMSDGIGMMRDGVGMMRDEKKRPTHSVQAFSYFHIWL